MKRSGRRASARVADLPNGVDPDQLAREKGKQAIDDLIANAKGMLEALIEMSLDESFTQADAYEKQARIAFVAKLLAEEDDPVVLPMLKGFTDRIAGRLDIVRSGEGAFRAVEHSVSRPSQRPRPSAVAPRLPRARSREIQTPPSDGNGTRIAPRAPGSAERGGSSAISWNGLRFWTIPRSPTSSRCSRARA